MSKTKFVKLGEKASSFSCPTTGVSLTKGKVVELNTEQLNSKKIKQALKGGHLEYASPEDIENSKGSDNVSSVAAPKSDDEVIYTEENLVDKGKTDLIQIASKFLEDDGEVKLKDLERMNKTELKEFIIESQESEEEE